MTGNATGFVAAPQHGPRPLPLFLDMLRSETIDQPKRRAAALAGLRAYQTATRMPRNKELPVVARAGRAMLHDGGGDGRPVVFVPSLINPPAILDLAAANSLLGWIAAQGHHAYLVDWGEPTGADAALDIAGHVERLLLPMLRGIRPPPVLVGYCLGGTMALASACRAPVAGLALIAAPWRFAGYGDATRAQMMALWDMARPACERLGLMPMEVLQAGFWRLDPARTIAKYEAFAAMEPDSEAARAFVLLEDWANGGAPLTHAAGSDLFERFARDDAPGTGRWIVDGATVGPEHLTCPTLDVVSLTDRIVPAASSAGLDNRRELGAGHVGMVVGSKARRLLWEPLAAWIDALA